MNKKQSILIWLSFFMLLSLATLSVVFAQTAGVKSVYDSASKQWVTVTPSPAAPSTAATATPDTNKWHTVVVTEEIEVTGTDGVTSTVIVTNTVVQPPTTKIVTEEVIITETVVIIDSQGMTHTVVVTRKEYITSTVRVEPPTPTPLPPPSTRVITETVVVTHDDGNISNITFTRTVPFVPDGLPTRLMTETIRVTDTNGVGVNIDVWITVPVYPTPTPIPTSTPLPTTTPWPTSAWEPTATPSWRPTATPTPEPVVPWRGQYFTNPEFAGQPRTRNDDTVDFTWGNGAAMPGMPTDYFSARWTYTEQDITPGFYRVSAVSDYGMRFSVNGQNVIDEIRNFNTNPKTAYFWSEGNQRLNYRYDYFHHTGYSVASVNVTPMGTSIAPFGRAVVVNGAPILRDGPGNYYNGNGRIETGETVTLTGHRNMPSNWVCLVREDGTTGWVNTFYLNSSVQFDSLRVWPMWIENGEPTATISRDYPTVSLRYGATPTSSVLAQAVGGSEVVLVGRSSTNNWILVRMWEGSLGWVPAVTLETRHNLRSLPLRYTVAAEVPATDE